MIAWDQALHWGKKELKKKIGEKSITYKYVINILII